MEGTEIVNYFLMTTNLLLLKDAGRRESDKIFQLKHILKIIYFRSWNYGNYEKLSLGNSNKGFSWKNPKLNLAIKSHSDTSYFPGDTIKYAHSYCLNLKLKQTRKHL